jgi:hypothetical protein
MSFSGINEPQLNDTCADSPIVLNVVACEWPQGPGDEGLRFDHVE